jgi:flagellar hook-associated protein 1 FlgK
LGADLFSIGQSSLKTSKKSLETTSHNIANSNTEGFSRQRITVKTGTPIDEGAYVMGSGVNVQSVKRVHDGLVEKNLNRSISQHKFNEERTFQLGRVEEIFNEINSDGLNKVLNRFFNTFRELSNQPENEVVRAMVRDNANLVVADFHRIDESIEGVKKSVDAKLKGSVAEINSLTNNVATLNKEIIRLEVTGGETGDLRDQRDNSIRTLADFFKLTTYEDEKGQYVVNVQGVGSIVAGGVSNKLIAAPVSPEGAKGEGQMEIFFDGKPGKPVTNKFKQGTIEGMVKTRNSDIVELRKQVDVVAHGLVNATNAIHRRGFANKRVQLDQSGNPILRGNEKLTNINFFEGLTDVKNAAENIAISKDVLEDLNNISTGLEANSPGDNRIAIAISKLQHEKILGEGSSTFEESYLTSVGKIGLSTAKSKIDTEQSSGILAQSKSIKERISGVSIDEETANMVKYQHAYDASARMIKTADEMFDSVLGMMRR